MEAVRRQGLTLPRARLHRWTLRAAVSGRSDVLSLVLGIPSSRRLVDRNAGRGDVSTGTSDLTQWSNAGAATRRSVSLKSPDTATRSHGGSRSIRLYPLRPMRLSLPLSPTS